MDPLFISHGSPMLPLEPDNPTFLWLNKLRDTMEKPKAILVISAHWEERVATITSSNNQIYDFYGLPSALYKIKYRPPEAPELAERVKQVLTDAGISCAHDKSRGLDHGTWNPLCVLYPEADVPVMQLSLLVGLDPAAHIKMGEALRPLLQEKGLLIIGSGSSCHNFASQMGGVKRKQWEDAFESFLYDTLSKDYADRNNNIINWKQASGVGALAHAREEHLAPLFVICGLAPGKAKRVTNFHGQYSYKFDKEPVAYKDL